VTSSAATNTLTMNYTGGSTFTISGVNSGSVTNGNITVPGGLGFSVFGNLTGGTGADSFAFALGGSVAGNIDGGAGSDTLDYSALGAVLNVTLTGAGSVDGFFGTPRHGVAGSVGQVNP